MLTASDAQHLVEGHAGIARNGRCRDTHMAHSGKSLQTTLSDEALDAVGGKLQQGSGLVFCKTSNSHGGLSARPVTGFARGAQGKTQLRRLRRALGITQPSLLLHVASFPKKRSRREVP